MYRFKRILINRDKNAMNNLKKNHKFLRIEAKTLIKRRESIKNHSKFHLIIVFLFNILICDKITT